MAAESTEFLSIIEALEIKQELGQAKDLLMLPILREALARQKKRP